MSFRPAPGHYRWMPAPAPERIELAVNVCGYEPDAVTVDALARLQLAVRRHGFRIRLRYASSELLELVAFMGLADVLPEDR